MWLLLGVDILAAVGAPTNDASGNPEVASTIVDLSNRRRDARSSEPVEADMPTRSSARRQSQLNLLSASTGTTQTRPFAPASVPDQNQRALGQLLGGWMASHGAGYEIGPTKQTQTYQQSKRGGAPHGVHPVRSRKGSMSPRPQLSLDAHTRHCGCWLAPGRRSCRRSNRRVRCQAHPSGPRKPVNA